MTRKAEKSWGVVEGGEDPGSGETEEAQSGGDPGTLESGEIQVAQFQGGGKMAGGGVGMDMGGMVPGGEGGEMSFRGPASGDGGVAGSGGAVAFTRADVLLYTYIVIYCGDEISTQSCRKAVV